ncbi:2'-5' RNA ligase family protein [Pseudoflavitalea sp. G-6-1-2]|uniref:2'-5' RNA ligase family protein n=1 Tax=Pseudoflavitalea sp. G-6-1-2 TaxID=2728841 RepID=UPI00146DF071|nr:hypothetical protein [Pseudoflavitalea sp. G-6-1-2]NML19631.1 2'-5' RNA ligase family protein [Pseudoflavitalea sp. G-6-1-2]
MHTGALNHTGSKGWNSEGLQEYRLVIQTDAIVRQQVWLEQQDLIIKYGLKGPIRSGNQITVARFAVREGMEDTLMRWMQKICSNHRSFMVTLNNYSGFPPNTIYLRVQDQWPFQQLIRQLKPVEDYIRSSACPPPLMNLRPYLDISGLLPEAVYEKAITDYARRSFHSSFLANDLLLIRSSPYEPANKTINVFRFLPGTYELYQEVS